MTGSTQGSFPQAPDEWWTRGAEVCPAGCLIEGAGPPFGSEVWCARPDGVKHGRSSKWVVGLRTDQHYVDGMKDGWEIEWDKDGALRVACEFKAGVRHGRVFRHFATWSEEGTYAHNKKHGVWTITRRDGSRARAESWEQGKLHGDYRRWHPNGELAEFGHYDRSARDGQWSWWYDNGAKACERAFARGEPAGTHRSWDRAGQLLDEVEFHHGTGRWTEFYDDGSNKLEGQYLDGRRHGLWSRWDRQGRLLGTFSFERGSGVEILWDDQGRKRSETEYRDGNEHGRAMTWDEDGRLTCVEQYNDGRLTLTHDYDVDGALDSSTEWDPDSEEIVKFSQYTDGRLVSVFERLPYGTRAYELENGQVQQIVGTIGNWVTTVHKGAPAGVTASRDQTESYDVGDLHVTFELVGDSVVAARFQVGENGASHRRMRFALTRTDREEARHPVEVENAGVPRPQLELVEFEQRIRDGTEFDVELSGGRVTLLVERRAGAIVRHVMPDEPAFLDIANLRRLFDSLPTVPPDDSDAPEE